MSGKINRALGMWVAQQYAGLHVCAEDVANDRYLYPVCVVTELTHGTTPLGAGKRHMETRDLLTGFIATVGRIHVANSTYRLTIQVPSTTTKSGREVCDEISSAVENGVLALQSNAGQTVLVDTGVTPSVSFPLESFRLVGRQQLDPDTDGEPVLYRSALTVQLVRLVPIQRPVEAVIETIIVEDEDAEEA